MPVSGGGFEQCYNAQALVDNDSFLIVAAHVPQNANDKKELEPALAALQALPESLGRAQELLADSGYFSGPNVELCGEARDCPLYCGRAGSPTTCGRPNAGNNRSRPGKTPMRWSR